MENSPIPSQKLTEVTKETCDSVFQNVTSYSHPQTETWNKNIINTILKSLISETSSPTRPPSYKFAVTSTIIQHTTSPAPSSTASSSIPTAGAAATKTTSDSSTPEGANKASTADDALAGGEKESKVQVGRRGMHTASGAYWNNDKDGMWSFKYDGAEGGKGKGFDVVVSIIWIAI
ncbi:hypothetical protein MMC09_005359 [Bachmanniomyces sp. S44760]|nr:hypothetical protein [Bachmanniomyces sp. S44760]